MFRSMKGGLERIGATWAVGARYRAREECQAIGIYGSGQQAPVSLEAHYRGRPQVKIARVYSPTKEHRKTFAQTMSKKLDMEVVPVDNPRNIMRNAGSVISVTTSTVARGIRGIMCHVD